MPEPEKWCSSFEVLSAELADTVTEELLRTFEPMVMAALDGTAKQFPKEFGGKTDRLKPYHKTDHMLAAYKKVVEELGMPKVRLWRCLKP